MTSTTFGWKHNTNGTAALRHLDTALVRHNSAATRRLGGVLLAAIVAAVMAGASSLFGSEGLSGALAWLALWAVGFAALLIFARGAFGLARVLHGRWTAHREEVQLQRAIAEDPRLALELQVMRDRMSWANN